ncbi:MAG: glycosyltransferase family 4 protein [Bacteroides sp.]|nr:glycosyltransferase family 4 protein [Bacteroides sp.]
MRNMKPRVLIVNKFYYPRGGDCVCVLNLERLLGLHGYETAVFSMDYSENIPSEWSPYFASGIDFSGSVSRKVDAVRRMLGFGDIRKSFLRILDEFNPDIVHLHNIHSYLSPQLALMARKRGKRVVWTLHDYKLICPSYSCLADGKVCEECVGGSSFGVVRHRCMKGSLAASLMAWLEASRWNAAVLQKNVDAFICPSDFMKRMMVKGGFDESKLVVNCNFIDPVRLSSSADSISESTDAGQYYCYVGRLSDEKGVELLLKAAARLSYPLKIAGGGPLYEELAATYGDRQEIEFLGPLSGDRVGALLRNARFSVVPSVWYENNPLSVIESLSLGTPVVGAAIGGIPELIRPGIDGLVFNFGDELDLTSKLAEAWNKKWDHEGIKAHALKSFSAETHLATLERAYGLK